MNPSDFFNQFNEKALRPLLNSVKEKLDQAIDSTPPQALSRQLEDALEQAKNGNANQQLDAAKLVPVVDALKKQLQNPAVSTVVAFAVKEALKKDNGNFLDASLANLPGSDFEKQLMAELLKAQLQQMQEELKKASVQEVAAIIRQNVAIIPSELIAEQLAAALKNAQPKQAAPDLSQLPSPDALADTTINLLKSFSNTLGNAAKGASLDETLNTLKQFPANLNDIISRLQPGNNSYNQPQPPAAEKKPVVKRHRKQGPGKKFDF